MLIEVVRHAVSSTRRSRHTMIPLLATISPRRWAAEAQEQGGRALSWSNRRVWAALEEPSSTRRTARSVLGSRPTSFAGTARSPSSSTLMSSSALDGRDEL